MTLLTQSALLVAITAFSMGISVLARRLTNRLAQKYFILSLVVWASFLSFFLKTAFQDDLFAQFQLISWVWLGPVGMALIPMLMGQEPPAWRWLRVFSWALAVGFSVSVLTGLISSEDRGFWMQLLRFSPGVLMAQTWVLLWTRRPLSIRDLLILGGAILTLAFTPLDHMPWMGTTLPALGNLFFCGYLILLGQAITRQKLVDLLGLIVRFVVLVILAVGFSGLYLLVATWSEATPAVFLLHSFAVSFCMVLLLDPLQAGVAYLTRRLLARGRSRRLDLDLAELEARLQGIQEPAVWQQALEEALCRIFAASRSGFIRNASVPDEQGTIASEILRRRAMHEVTLLVRGLIESERSLSASRRERDRLEALGVEMARAGYDIIIPFFDTELMGFIWLAGIRDESRLTPLGSAALLGAVERFAKKIGPIMRAMLRIRSLGEQERLATLGELSAGLAHEIRNPLGAIQGAIELLPDSQWSKVIQQEVKRLEGLVRQFLELSRRRDADMGWVDASRWLEQIRPRIEANDVEVVGLSERTDLLSLGFVGDPERLLQVVDNWIRNARQAKASRIQMGLDWVEGSGELGIYVQDNGEGIAEDDLQKIFAPFFTTRSEGTGLGLSICRQIAQNHEGRIEVKSKLGQGTRFTFWLPTALPDAAGG
jgi:two-component system sensor histidine kinase HydH